MSRPSSLIWLVNSLSKAEKKAVSENFSGSGSDYVSLYQLLVRSPGCDLTEIKARFSRERPGSSFHMACNRLFETLTALLTKVNRQRDTESDLILRLAEARTLYSKSLYDEVFLAIKRVKQECIDQEKEYILLIARRMELDFLLALGFPDMTEKNLLSRQVKINDSLKVVRKLNEHSALYELLRLRTDHNGAAKDETKDRFSDLVVSEMGISSGLGSNKFNIKKVHQLFQSNYLLNAGDYRSALNSFNQLNTLFENNRHLWKNPPVDYVTTIEGVLESLRSVGKYDEMAYFVGKLKEIKMEHAQFQLELLSIIFLYEVFPYIDKGRYSGGLQVYGAYKDQLHVRAHLLPVSRQLQLSLYTAILFLEAGMLGEARKAITRSLMYDKNQYTKYIYKASRLVRLLVMFEKKDYDFVYNESRSIRREISTQPEPMMSEQLLLKVLAKITSPLTRRDRQKYFEKIKPRIDQIRQSKQEFRLLRLFDFSAWIEARLTDRPLDEVLTAG